MVASQFATVAHKIALLHAAFDSMGQPALAAAAGLFRETVCGAENSCSIWAPPCPAQFRKFIVDWDYASTAAALAATGVVKAFQAWQTLHKDYCSGQSGNNSTRRRSGR